MRGTGDLDALARPARSERCVSGLASGSTPTTRVRGLSALTAVAHAGQQPAAAERDEHDVEVVDLVEQFEPGRALAGHDERLVVGVHERQAASRARSSAIWSRSSL